VRRTTKRVLIAACAVVGAAAIAAGGFYVLRGCLRRGRARPKSVQADPIVATPEPPLVRLPVQFTRAGVPGRIVEALEYVVGKGRAQAAAWPLQRPRCLCVMVDGAERFYELDQGMKADAFEGLAECGFRPLPPAMTRTTSNYRAVTKRAVPAFNEDIDRILVLLCPQKDWPTVSLRWPPIPARPK